MRAPLTHVAAALALSVVLSCDKSPAPSAPTPPMSPAPPGLVEVSVLGPSLLRGTGSTAQMLAFAHFNDGSQTEVTRLATWRSSNTAVATVSMTGAITTAGEGETEIRGSYGGMEGASMMMVLSGLRYGPLFPDEVKGRVHEAAPMAYVAIPYARVQISGGAHHGRVVEITGIVGEFRFGGVRHGGFDLLVTRPGYLPARYHVAQLPDAAAIVAMTPEPDLVSDVFEGNVCTQNPSGTFFTPSRSGLFRVSSRSVGLWESSHGLSLLVNGVALFPWLYDSVDYEVQAGPRYELRMSRGAICDGTGAFRVNFLRPR